jgi:tRNA 2-thiouridine synthesizing protein A
MRADRTLDCYGLLCPMPIIKTAQEFKNMKVGEILEVISTDDGIKHDMPAWCKTTGNEFLGVEEKEGEYRAYVKKLTD